MKYKGKLYGKLGSQYFDTGRSSEDWDLLIDSIVAFKEWEKYPSQDNYENLKNKHNDVLKKIGVEP
jgi:hypothetical protein